MKDRKRRCIPCKIEGKKETATKIADGIPVCEHHYDIWKSELNLEEDEESED